MNKSFTKYANNQLKNIHRLSKKYNNLLGRDHAAALLDIIKEHTTEIRGRYRMGDKHYIIETGDLIILCLELLKEARISPDKVLSECYIRYNKKLPSLINNSIAIRRKNGK
jgi:hypothetical protein